MKDKEYVKHIKQNSEYWRNLYYIAKDIIEKQDLIIKKLENKISAK